MTNRHSLQRLLGRRQSFSRLVIATMALTAAAHAVRAEVVENFESSPSVERENNEQELLECSIAEDPAAAGNKVLKMEWSSHNGTHVGANLAGARPVLISEPGKYKITARVNLEQINEECTSIALRLLDGSGNETFQVYAPLEQKGEPGWQELSWELDTENFDLKKTPSWGQQVNGIIEMPAHLLGFAVGFRDWKTKGGQILIDDITVTKAD